MAIEVFRDWVLSIFLLAAIVFLIYALVISFRLYKRITRVLDTIDIIVTRIKSISEFVDQVSQPLFKIVACLESVRDGVIFARGFFGKDKSENTQEEKRK